MYLVPQFAHTPSPDGTATVLAAVPLAAVSGGAKAAGTDNFRRQVTVNTYVVDESEF